MNCIVYILDLKIYKFFNFQKFEISEILIFEIRKFGNTHFRISNFQIFDFRKFQEFWIKVISNFRFVK